MQAYLAPSYLDLTKRQDIVVADLVADMVADMEVDMVPDMEVDKVADIVVDIVANMVAAKNLAGISSTYQIGPI